MEHTTLSHRHDCVPHHQQLMQTGLMVKNKYLHQHKDSLLTAAVVLILLPVLTPPTNHPVPLRVKMEGAGVDQHLAAWPKDHGICCYSNHWICIGGEQARE